MHPCHLREKRKNGYANNAPEDGIDEAAEAYGQTARETLDRVSRALWRMDWVEACRNGLPERLRP